MIVPQHWAEARLQHRGAGRQVTVRRFGWSDVSVAEAQALADARAREALDRILAGEPLERREPRRAYNGAQGVPIREQVLAREGATVITRNGYGARCLNTEAVLFADVDFDLEPSWVLRAALALPVLLLALLVGRGAGVCAGVGVLVFALGFGQMLAAPLLRAWQALHGGRERWARRHVDAFVRRHPDWHLRLYRTPAGLRVLALHRTFDPAEPAVRAFFRALRVDPVYEAMCLRQHCFRARLTAKPWRIGVPRRVPRRATWPFEGERLARYEAWVAQYEDAAQGYAACAVLGDVGSSTVDPEAERVRRLHDTLSGAQSGRPIA